VTGESVGLGVYVVGIIAGFQAFTSLPVILESFALPYRLSCYQLKLFTADPGSSEVVDGLSDAINGILFIAAILLTLFTFLVFLANPWVVGVYILPLLWVFLIVIFSSSHYALAKIINKTKWRVLNGVQTQIEALQTQEEILSEQTLSHINKLLDYHNRIKTTRNSAVDVRAGLNLLQSLLLPLVGLLLANIKSILEIFFK